MKTKLVVRPCIITIKFEEKSIFKITIGFTPHWDYKNQNEYSSQKIINLIITNKINLICDVIDGNVVNGLR